MFFYMSINNNNKLPSEFNLLATPKLQVVLKNINILSIML